MLFLFLFVDAFGAAIHNPVMAVAEFHVFMKELSADLLHCSPLAALSASGS